MTFRIARTNGVHRLSLCFAFSALFAASITACAEQPLSANAIVDSVGINVHLHYTDTPYKNFELVQKLLTELGVHHIRDGVVDTTWSEYYTRHNTLGKRGIKCLFVTNVKQSEALLLKYPEKMRDSFEGFEAPNEYNQSGDGHWSETLKTFMPTLQHVVQRLPGSGGILVGPSLTQPNAYVQTAGLEGYFQYANLHNYFAGRNPGTSGWGGGGYGSINWNMKLAKDAWGDKPIFTTETGYSTDPENKQSVPEEVESIYMPRLVLEQLTHHIQRTYIYELIDVGPKVSKDDAAFGLVRNDGTVKPAYSALKNLLMVASDPGHPATLDDLPIHLSGNMSGVDHLVAQRSDGSTLFFFWIERSVFDQQNKKVITNAPQSLTFEISESPGSLELVTFAPSGEVVRKPIQTSTKVSLDAKETMSILIVTPSSNRHSKTRSKLK